MEEHFKIFGDNIGFRMMVIWQTEHNIKVLGMDILEAFNRALYVNYCRCIAVKFGFDPMAVKLGFDVVNDAVFLD